MCKATCDEAMQQNNKAVRKRQCIKGSEVVRKRQQGSEAMRQQGNIQNNEATSVQSNKATNVRGNKQCTS
jgi:hypothetical protein